jgi:hypothetical protein
MVFYYVITDFNSDFGHIYSIKPEIADAGFQAGTPLEIHA